ncbi:DUF2975 domain-containing protein [Pedobacter frigoris]|uniref:DUF2975 domain-containing protein n=1 Tax=Pedobacter frigoris TaxID=2571272 RepID=A0A4U1CJY5_9SPHI|nr:DUF2975 domain-containing protein [Pedobacter frigoris]TKC06926.1 DUF2975 domain-containing protein [Pedobacter frigoris]
MKIIIPSQKTINITIGGLAILFIGFVILLFQTSRSTSTTGTTIISTHDLTDQLPPIDPEIPRTLPYDQYKQKTDSIRFKRKLLNGTFGNSVSLPGIGAKKASSENFVFDPNENPKKRIYMIMLQWWTLDTGTWENPIKYYVKDDKAYLRKTKCQSIKSKTANLTAYKCKEIDVPIPFRYNPDNKSIMIPVSKTTVDVMFIMFPISLAITFIGVIYFLFGGFIQFLFEIARGNPFSETNVKRLKRMATILFAIPIFLFSFNSLLYLIFQRYFTPDVKMSADIWAFLWKPAILGLIFTALYFAFRQGKRLKDEQDLTV